MAEQFAIRNAMVDHPRRLSFVGTVARRILRFESAGFRFHRLLPQGEEYCQTEIVTS